MEASISPILPHDEIEPSTSTSGGSVLQFLYQVLRPCRGSSHEERLKHFYRGQASIYDETRRRMLWGRAELMREATKLTEPDSVWYDLGCGTGSNLEHCTAIRSMRQIVLADLCEPLLDVARERVRRLRLGNVSIRRGDIVELNVEPGTADLVTFSYSLTMIPDWFRALDIAHRLLRPGGVVAVVDFFVGRRYGPERHSMIRRRFCQTFFGLDNVELSHDHLPYLRWQFDQMDCVETLHRLPYIRLRVPVFRYLGRKRINS